VENLYKLVQWPESQLLMDHPDFKACHLIIDPEWMEVGSSAYFVPIDIYNQYFGEEVYNKEQVMDLLFTLHQVMRPDDFASSKGLDTVDFLDLIYDKPRQIGLLDDYKEMLTSDPNFIGNSID
jgi:hypothetical protein